MFGSVLSYVVAYVIQLHRGHSATLLMSRLSSTSESIREFDDDQCYQELPSIAACSVAMSIGFWSTPVPCCLCVHEEEARYPLFVVTCAATMPSLLHIATNIGSDPWSEYFRLSQKAHTKLVGAITHIHHVLSDGSYFHSETRLFD